MKRNSFLQLCALALLVTVAPSATAGTFTDTFTPNPSPLWGNEVGNWTASGGIYDAQSYGGSPFAHSLLPWSMSDFTLSVSFVSADGGIWLRATDDASSFGVSGIVLVLRGGDYYWSLASNGSWVGPTPFLDYHSYAGGPHQITITGQGTVFTAYFDGSSSPASSIDISTWYGNGYDATTFASGKVGLDDNGLEKWSNFSVTSAAISSGVPEPASVLLVLFGLGGVATIAKRKHHKA